MFIASVEDIKKTYKHLCHYFDIAYGEKPNDILVFNHALFCERYELKHRTTYHVLKVLERGQLLTLTQYNKQRDVPISSQSIIAMVFSIVDGLERQ